ncbi:Relaxase/Mobilization nuclease domain protein [Pelagimonas phthalicica]|uniref:Relaxase/Mobilization nuclease domain protein n=1 Tax=Pelagimonas phthalicica TaxID=1037362 RepID=A0A238JCS9_9RHOB|nr:relaxase/mobilization nuclease domain-containing protein [Pelagimonas phthalicica]TDS91136.1 relaxase/mobilization nuclease-like protein [Pelagimonas phthalicica]SMX28183.1 Relaxase/Mobilization nuclease domain protein [Pelagimonas phthalicica]
MILKGSQRGHGTQLSRHLLNDQDNDHVEVHSVDGFLSEDVTEAFAEIEAIAKGTKCRQMFFSVSLSPPMEAKVDPKTFDDAIDRLAEANGLQHQPRVVIFHEKDGRRHAHVVFSRIDPASMTAINLPHYKNRLQTLSRQLFLENAWKMPAGLRDCSLKSPTNVTLAEWQAAKRRGKNAIDQKALIQQCWAVSDSRAGFEAALADHGYRLAKGDRRGHVIVCHDGEVFTVARATGLRAKAVKERLGAPDDLQSVAEAMEAHRADVRGQFGRMAGEARAELALRRQALDTQRAAMIATHRKERARLSQGQAKRWAQETAARKARFQAGLSGLWQRLSGKRRAITRQNECEALAALDRDKAQKQALSEAQLAERRVLEEQRRMLSQKAMGLIREMRSERDELVAKLSAPQPTPRRKRKRPMHDAQIAPFPGPEP